MTLFRSIRRGMLLAGMVSVVTVVAVACSDDAEEAETTPEPTAAAATATAEGTAAATATAAPESAGSIKVSDAWARETAGNPGENSAIYASLTNETDQDDVLVGARLPEGMVTAVEIHEMVPSGANMMMQELDGGLPLPVGETAVLEPGGYHVMLMGLNEQLVAGEHIHVVFIFEQAGEVEVEVEVRAAGEMGAMGGTGAH